MQTACNLKNKKVIERSAYSFLGYKDFAARTPLKTFNLKTSQPHLYMKHEFAFSKMNFYLLAVGIAIVMVGLILMSGGGTTVEQFDPEIFNARRIRVAPMVTFFGYLFIVVAILYRSKDKNSEYTK